LTSILSGLQDLFDLSDPRSGTVHVRSWKERFDLSRMIGWRASSDHSVCFRGEFSKQRDVLGCSKASPHHVVRGEIPGVSPYHRAEELEGIDGRLVSVVLR
jgi:hypothetical protein